MNDVWIIAEQRLGRLADVSMELMGKGSELAGTLGVKTAGVILGDAIDTLTHELVHCGADRVYLAEDSRLRLFRGSVYTQIIAKLIKTEQPQIILVGATSIGQELASRVAAKVRTGLTAHCVDLFIDKDSRMVGVVPGWGGSLTVQISCPERRPQMATVSPGVMEKGARVEGRSGEIIRLKVDENFTEDSETLEMVEEEPSGATLDNAEVIVAGGWGLSSVGSFGPVEEMARLLNGAVAGTRSAMDKGWIPESQMVGQSGKTVSPRLFISVGASGASQFINGFTRSKVIMAIDKNPHAPIFDIADIGIVGDLHDILPHLIAELKGTRLNTHG